MRMHTSAVMWNGNILAQDEPPATGDSGKRLEPAKLWSVTRNRASILLSIVLLCYVTAPRCAESVGDGILVKVAATSSKIRAVSYSGVRQYNLRNYRFKKEASVTVRMTYTPDVGKTFTVTERRGSARLLDIVEKLLASEAEASWPNKVADYEISPANYRARLRGTEPMAGRDCYVVDLVPKRKNKYLIRGTAWVDRESFDVVRLEGVTSGSVSVWIGTPHLTLDFDQFGSLWLPVRVESISSTLLLGASELEIHYMDYFVDNRRPFVPEPVATFIQGRQK